MRSLRETLLLCAILLVAAPLAAAQDDPTLNESDMDTSPPESDESYLDDGSNATADEGSAAPEDPTLAESDFDMSAPAVDESYLGDESAGASSGASSETPGIGLVAAVGAVALAALVLARR